MKFKWFVFASIVVAVKSASVFQKGRNIIPVQIVYEKSNYPAVRNVEVEDQEKSSAGMRNFGEKQQLSENELKEAPEAAKIVTPDNPYQQVDIFGIVPRPQPELLPLQQIQTISQQNPFVEHNIDDIYDKIQEIILSGSKNIKSVVEADDKFSYNKEKFLEKVNSTLENFLVNAKKIIERRGLKQAEQNGFQAILSSFQQAASNIFSGFTNSGGQQNDDQTQTQNPIQVIFTQIQNSIQQITGGNAPTTQSTVLGDAPATTPSSGPVAFFQNAVQTIQQGFNNLIQGQGSTAAPGSQGDESNSQINNPIGFIQNAIQNINIPNPFQPQTQAPGSQGDSPSTTPGGPLAFIQNAVNAVNAINPFNQPTTHASVQSDTSTAKPVNNPATAIQGAITNASQAIPGNPAQGIINQIGAAVGQQSGPQEIVNQITQQGNQITQNIPGQNIINQVSETINQQASGTPIGNITNTIGTNPIQAGQNVVSQIAGAANPAAGGGNIPGQEIVNQIVQATGQNS